MEKSHDWKSSEIEGKVRKKLRSKLSILGKRVRRMGEEGILVITSFDDGEPEYFIEYKEDDREQLIGLPFEIWDDVKGTYVDKAEINPFVELTSDEIDYLYLDDRDTILRNI